jgi:hypothetical protein
MGIEYLIVLRRNFGTFLNNSSVDIHVLAYISFAA